MDACSCQVANVSRAPVLGEVEGGVEFDPVNPVMLRRVDGGDGGVVRVNGNEVFILAGCEEGAIS
jgi:hypothetical protein